MVLGVVRLAADERLFVEEVMQAICERGGWVVIEAASQPDHGHVVLDIETELHGKQVRPTLKRWLSDALNERFGKKNCWAEGGSTRAVRGHEYRSVAPRYVREQKAIQPKGPPQDDPF